MNRLCRDTTLCVQATCGGYPAEDPFDNTFQCCITTNAFISITFENFLIEPLKLFLQHMVRYTL